MSLRGSFVLNILLQDAIKTVKGIKIIFKNSNFLNQILKLEGFLFNKFQNNFSFKFILTFEFKIQFFKANQRRKLFKN